MNDVVVCLTDLAPSRAQGSAGQLLRSADALWICNPKFTALGGRLEKINDRHEQGIPFQPRIAAFASIPLWPEERGQ
jgi:hypothetical protein